MCHPSIKSEGELQRNVIIVALQMGQEQSTPCAKEDLPTLCKLRDRKEVSIGVFLISFGHGDSVENEKREKLDRG
jgi:hypothetical protein